MFSLRFRSLELLYSITSDSVCQELFSSFFKLFRKLSLFAPLSRTASIYYHVPNNLSSTKLKVFQLFSYPPLTDLLQGRSTTETSDQRAALTIRSFRGSAVSRRIFTPLQFESHRWCVDPSAPLRFARDDRFLDCTVWLFCLSKSGWGRPQGSPYVSYNKKGGHKALLYIL